MGTVSIYVWPEMPVNPTDDQKKVVFKERMSVIRSAQKVILALVAQLATGETYAPTADVIDAATFLSAKRAVTRDRGGVKVKTIAEQVQEFFANPDNLESGKIGEISFLVATKISRRETMTAIKHNLKTVKPEERLWITFDTETDEFFVDGQGATPPNGWTGYLPDAAQ